MSNSAAEFWANYVLSLRRDLRLGQEELAERLNCCQSSVSRWERGLTRPNYKMRKRMAELRSRSETPVAMEESLVYLVCSTIVRNMKQPAIIFRRDGTVIATTPGTAYRVGATYREQSTPEDLREFDEFEAYIEEIGFWDSPEHSIEYFFGPKNNPRCNVLTPLRFGNLQLCLVQKIDID